MAKIYNNFINGKWVPSKSGRTYENRNPANYEEVVGIFPSSDVNGVEEAVGAAKTNTKNLGILAILATLIIVGVVLISKSVKRLEVILHNQDFFNVCWSRYTQSRAKGL